MCNIFVLEPGQMPTKDQVWNCVYNNWHSLGAIIRHHEKEGDRLEVFHHVPQSGELDPKMVYDVMNDNVDKQRIIHVRHNTAGSVSLENCHPFTIYKSDDEEVYFMHNGTLYTYKSTLTAGQSEFTGPSDSKNFADKMLIPLFSKLQDPDINSEITRKIVDKFWAGSNRGILISKTSEKPYFIDPTGNPWKKIEGEKGGEFISANDDYFKEVKRGPEFMRRKAEEERKKAEEDKKVKSNVVSLSSFSKKEKHGFHNLSTSPSNILNDWEFYDRAHAIAAGYLMRHELKSALEDDPEGFLDLVEWIFTDYAQLFNEHEEAEGKLERATKIIATMKANRKEPSVNEPVKEESEEVTSAGSESAEEPTRNIHVG